MIAAAVLVAGGLGLVLWLRGRGGDEPAVVADDAGAGGDGVREPPRLNVTPRRGAGPHKATGVVVDVAGRPVIDVAITATIEMGPGVTAMPPKPGTAVDPPVIAVAAADGSFALEGLAAGRHRLLVEGPDIFTSEIRFVEVPSDGLRLVVARRVEVYGLVRDGGKPVAGIEVSLASEAGAVERTTSGADGRVEFGELAQGVFQVWAVAGTRAAPAQRVDRVDPAPPTGWPDVIIDLQPAEVVRGVVIDRATNAGVAAAVVLTPDAAGEAPRYARSGPDGTFAVDGVLAGSWTAEAFAPGYLGVDEVHFTTGGATGYTPRIEVVRGAIAAGVVVDGEGAPVRGAMVAVRGTDAAGSARSFDETAMAERTDRFTGRPTGPVVPGQRFLPRGELGVLLGPIPFPPPPGATRTRVADIVAPGAPAAADQLPAPRPELEPRFVTDDQGRFRVTGLPPGSYRVTASHPDHADGDSATFTLKVGQVIDDLRVVLYPGVMIAGKVTDDHGALVVGATIVADRADGKVTPDLRLQAVTGVDGLYRLGPIAADVNLRVTAVGHGDAERAIKVGELGRARVERTEDFVLARADAVLEGRVRDGAGFPVRGAQVAIVRRDRFQGSERATTDDNGRFTIANLAAGTYPISISHEDFPPLESSGATGAPVDLTLPFGGGIDAQVRDAGTLGPVPGAQVTATGPKGNRAEAIADDQGGLELGPLVPGAWKLAVDAPGYVALTQEVDVPAGSKPGAFTVHDLRIPLARGATIGGIVIDVNGQRVRGAKVTAGARTTTTDELGRFRLTDVPTGTLTIAATREAARGTLDVNLAPADESLTLQITIE